jgi:hypothetical protein
MHWKNYRTFDSQNNSSLEVEYKVSLKSQQFFLGAALRIFALQIFVSQTRTKNPLYTPYTYKQHINCLYKRKNQKIKIKNINMS